MKLNTLIFSIQILICAQTWAGIMPWQDLPIQDERLSSYSSIKISSTKAFIGFWSITTLNEMARITRLASRFKSTKNQRVTEKQVLRIKQFYPQLNITSSATRKDIEAVIDEIEC